MKPLSKRKGRSVMGRQFYDCGCGHRFRSTVVAKPDTVKCPACRQPCGVDHVSPPKERGGVVYPRWLKERDQERAVVERAVRIVVPKGEKLSVVRLGPGAATPSPFPAAAPDAPEPPAPPDQPDHIDPSPGEMSGESGSGLR